MPLEKSESGLAIAKPGLPDKAIQKAPKVQATRQRAAEAVQSTTGFATDFMSEVLEGAQQEAAQRLREKQKQMKTKMADKLVAAVESEAETVGDFFGVNLSGIVSEAIAQWDTPDVIDV